MTATHSVLPIANEAKMSAGARPLVRDEGGKARAQPSTARKQVGTGTAVMLAAGLHDVLAAAIALGILSESGLTAEPAHQLAIAGIL